MVYKLGWSVCGIHLRASGMGVPQGRIAGYGVAKHTGLSPEVDWARRSSTGSCARTAQVSDDDLSTTAPVATNLNCESCSSASRSDLSICWSITAALSNSTG
jgi:hypothetical protein